METFKERWEITRNWQLIHPFLGVIAILFSGYLITKGIVKNVGLTNDNLELSILSIGTILFSYLILKISLWLFSKLYSRWAVKYRWELIAIFLAFAVTGSTAGRLSEPLMDLIGLTKETTNGWIYWPVRVVLIFPIYQILLVIFGWIFGQYTFFKAFAIKMVARMGFGFLFKST